MILPDSSAWIEYLRGTESPTHLRLRELVTTGEVLATTEPVMMELLAGTGSERQRGDVHRLLARCEQLAVETPDDWMVGAELHRACRIAGETPRSMLDCLIAAVAIRAGAELLHRDADFDTLARHTPLLIARAGG